MFPVECSYSGWIGTLEWIGFLRQPFLKKSHDVSPIQSIRRAWCRYGDGLGLGLHQPGFSRARPRFWSRGVESIENRREASENRNGAKIGRRCGEQSALRLRNDRLWIQVHIHSTHTNRSIISSDLKVAVKASDNEFAIASADETIFCDEQKGWYDDANWCVKPITNIGISRY